MAVLQLPCSFIHGDELTDDFVPSRGKSRLYENFSTYFLFLLYSKSTPFHFTGMDEAQAAMMNSIYGGVGKLFLLFFLASQPAIQEYGAIFAIGFGVLITSFLHIASIRQQTKD